jgi:hypothetical protein
MPPLWIEEFLTFYPGKDFRATVSQCVTGTLRAFAGRQETSWDYSKFCTCSRICSIATFISTLIVVSSSAADLLPKVLASRCSS